MAGNTAIGQNDTTRQTENLKVREVAQILGVGKTLVYALIGKGELGSVKIGNARRVPRAELDAYLARVAYPAKA